MANGKPDHELDRVPPSPRGAGSGGHTERSAPLPGRIGRALEPVYRAAISGINRRYDAGSNITRLDVPVISVGNLSSGGTGKSPMVHHIVTCLLRDGGRPCIAMRGYTRRGARHGPDEADSYRRALPEVPVVAQPDRIAGLRALVTKARAAGKDRAPTCIVLDDGFQHRKIARDLDIVLIDASRSPFIDRLLPAGWLREPVESLARADLVVLTHAELAAPPAVHAIEQGVRMMRGGLGLDASTRHVWTGLWITAVSAGSEGSGERTDQLVGLEWLLGKRVVASCAIGNPRGFVHSLKVTLGEGKGAGTLGGVMVLPDHDPYGAEVVSALNRMAEEEAAEVIVVTDKDWSKLRHIPPERWGGRPVVRPRLSLVFDRGGPEFDATVAAVGRRRLRAANPDRPGENATTHS